MAFVMMFMTASFLSAQDESINIAKFKDVKMTAYDLRFTCNVSLPNYIGLGKGVSHGFGTIRKIQ